MTMEAIYELPMLSQTLLQEPQIDINHLNMTITLKGENLDGLKSNVKLVFNTVLCYKHTSESFTSTLYNAYDKIVELKDSEWLKEMSLLNSHSFQFWNPKHYVLYLDSRGLYQFIAKGFDVYEGNN